MGLEARNFSFLALRRVRGLHLTRRLRGYPAVPGTPYLIFGVRYGVPGTIKRLRGKESLFSDVPFSLLLFPFSLPKATGISIEGWLKRR